MADDGRTEKPTPRRLERARKEGNFPTAREFVSAVHFAGFVAIATTFGEEWLIRLAGSTRYLLAHAVPIAVAGDLSPARVVWLFWNVVAPTFLPLLLAGGALALLSLGAQFAITRGGISIAKLTPDIQRLNVLKKLTSLPGQNLPMLLQALILLPIVAFVVYGEVTENLNSFLALPWMAAPAAVMLIGGTLAALMWRAAGLFLVIGVAEMAWQRRRYMNQLRMTKQEIREEMKDQQGSPQVKGKIRRLQRDMARRQMMKNVAKATAVIVNPTHYAVAIRYVLEAGAAPVIVAKGKNYLAARIRQKAIENQIPIVENAPLAQALYKSVDIGQEIPSHLYRAVAEILAYIYKMMNGRLPG